MIEWSREPKFTLIFKNKAAFKKAILRGDAYTTGTEYIEGRLEIEGDIFEAIRLGDYLAQVKLSRRDKLNILLRLLRL